MNRKFNGKIEVGSRKGFTSRAAKAAFKDIHSDPDMRVKYEWGGIEIKVSVILTDTILDLDRLEGVI